MRSGPPATSARSARGGTRRPRWCSSTSPRGGTVIDTPGIRSFGFAHVTADDVLAAFDEIAEAAVDCPPGCGHTANDPACALDTWAATGPPARQEQLAGLRVLLGAVGQLGPGY